MSRQVKNREDRTQGLIFLERLSWPVDLSNYQEIETDFSSTAKLHRFWSVWMNLVIYVRLQARQYNTVYCELVCKVLFNFLQHCNELKCNIELCSSKLNASGAKLVFYLNCALQLWWMGKLKANHVYYLVVHCNIVPMQWSCAVERSAVVNWQFTAADWRLQWRQPELLLVCTFSKLQSLAWHCTASQLNIFAQIWVLRLRWRAIEFSKTPRGLWSQPWAKYRQKFNIPFA